MTFFTKPELVENAIVQLTMDGKAYNRLKNHIETMGIHIDRVEKFDTVNIEYEFTISYYNIVNSLKSLIILLNDPTVSAAMIGSKDDLNLLLVDLVDAVRSVQKALETIPQKEEETFGHQMGDGVRESMKNDISTV